eukprot:TRINITY_DN16849_c0_g1_i1.p1 TRINITY_DN16849_c0_g1~~TRINITY_DN16849_c0_g1_i1.p1  ORF type:complete len:398 (+),score=82.71 TRINITY_DN16849_c0_g1_i1:183-1376(+)
MRRERLQPQDPASQIDKNGQMVVKPDDPCKKESLIEFSTEGHDDPNEGLTFADTPVHCTCPHCDRSVITFIDHETSWVTWVLGFVVWISLGWMAFWVLPLLWPAFKDVVHHCPRCLNVIARKSRISLPTFKTEVMSVKIGGCAIVLARKYVIIAGMLVALIGGAYVLRSVVPMNTMQEVEKGVASQLTWEDFLFDCGPRTALQHRASTSRAFDEKYRRKTFTWQGEVRTIREGFDIWFLHTKSIVLVRMYPSRYPRRDHPDVGLLFGENLNAEVAELNPGDWVQFEATMAAHGHRGDPEVMMLWHIKVVPKPSPLSSSAALGDASGAPPTVAAALSAAATTGLSSEAVPLASTAAAKASDSDNAAAASSIANVVGNSSSVGVDASAGASASAANGGA